MVHIGIHVHMGKFKSSYLAVGSAVEEYGLDTVQIFSHGPRGYNGVRVDEESMAKLNNVLIYIHGSYVSSPWNGNPRTLDHIEDQFKVCSNVRAEGLVIHLRKDEIYHVISVVKQMLERSHGQKLILEAPAMHASALTFESAERLNLLIYELRKFASSDMVGICIDTSHETSGGIRLRTYDEAKSFFEAIRHPEYISLIHLNGTSYPLGSGKDCHQVIFTEGDQIWSGIEPKLSGVAYIVKFCKRYNVPIILEIHNDVQAPSIKKAVKTLKKLTHK